MNHREMRYQQHIPFAALLADATWQMLSDQRPLLGTETIDELNDLVVLL
jgi:hypothetical protein